jgi:hypothetical protein
VLKVDEAAQIVARLKAAIDRSPALRTLCLHNGVESTLSHKSAPIATAELFGIISKEEIILVCELAAAHRRA